MKSCRKLQRSEQSINGCSIQRGNKFQQAMDMIKDEDICRYWSEHFPKRTENVRSKTLCLTLFYVIADRAHSIYPQGDWSDKIQHALRFYGVPKEEYYEVGKDAVEEPD